MKKLLFLFSFLFSIFCSFSAFAEGMGTLEFSVNGATLHNPQIEVYIESNGKFYDDITLEAGSYDLKRSIPCGSYTLYSRVRFDSLGEYKISNEVQNIEIKNNMTAPVRYSLSYMQQDFSDDYQSKNTDATESSKEELKIQDPSETLSDEDLHKLVSSVNEDIKEDATNVDNYERENNFMALHGLEDKYLDAKLNYDGREAPAGSGKITVSFPDYDGETINVSFYNKSTAYSCSLSKDNGYTGEITVPVGKYTFYRADTLSYSKRFNIKEDNFYLKNEENKQLILIDYEAPDSVWLKNPFEIAKKSINPRIFITFSFIIILCVAGVIHYLYRLTHKGPDEFM